MKIENVENANFKFVNFLPIYFTVIIKPYENFWKKNENKKSTLLKAGNIYSRFFQTREISFPVHKYVFMHINDVIAYNTTKWKMENYSGKNYVFFSYKILAYYSSQ